MNRQDKAFMAMFSAVLGVLVVVALVIFVIARMISGTADRGYDRNQVMEQATAERLKPVGHVVVAGSAEAKAEQQSQGSQQAASTGSSKSLTGEQVYKNVCSACHAVGALGSPKFGDKAAWEPRYKQGLKTLISHALHGYKKMPAKGGNASLTEQNIHDAIVYMLTNSGIKVGAAGENKQEAAAQQAAGSSGQAAGAGKATKPAAPSGGEKQSANTSAGTNAGQAKASANSQSGQGQTGSSGGQSTQPTGNTQNGQGSAAAQQSSNQSNNDQQASRSGKSADGTAETVAQNGGGFHIPANIDPAKGENTFKTVCSACHGQGIAGAPKFGDKQAWAPRIAQGWKTLAQHALHGYKAMPPKGGRPDLPDQQILEAMAYMASHSE